METKETVSETRSIFNKLSNKTRSIFEALTEMIHKGVTVKEIAEMVKDHESTQTTSKTLLGITYDFYKLKIQDLIFQLEIKQGVSEQILYFKVYTSDHIVFTYRSYEDGLILSDQIKTDHLPEIVKYNK